jgi:hypothetical protein
MNMTPNLTARNCTNSFFRHSIDFCKFMISFSISCWEGFYYFFYLLFCQFRGTVPRTTNIWPTSEKDKQMKVDMIGDE